MTNHDQNPTAPHNPEAYEALNVSEAARRLGTTIDELSGEGSPGVHTIAIGVQRVLVAYPATEQTSADGEPVLPFSLGLYTSRSEHHGKTGYYIAINPGDPRDPRGSGLFPSPYPWTNGNRSISWTKGEEEGILASAVGRAGMSKSSPVTPQELLELDERLRAGVAFNPNTHFIHAKGERRRILPKNIFKRWGSVLLGRGSQP